MELEEILNLESKVEGKEIIGSPYKVGEITFIPIINLLVGGGVKGDTTGGGGVSISPAAVIMIKPDNKISFFSFQEDYSEEEIEEKMPVILKKIKQVN